MQLYIIFWTVLVVSILTWYVITIVHVAKRGYADLVKMFQDMGKDL